VTKREKLRARLRNNPKRATKQEVENLLLGFGFTLDRVSGSHHVYYIRDEDKIQRVVIPIHGQKVKPKYVLFALEAIDAFFPPDASDESEDQDESDND
jgi:predicted RNA binding protein YcfA (HicA-like mRNA interferase family)